MFKRRKTPSTLRSILQQAILIQETCQDVWRFEDDCLAYSAAIHIERGDSMNMQTTAKKLELVKPQQAQKQKPRALDDVLSENRGKPCAFKSWSVMVDKQVDTELLKRKLDKSRLSEKQLAVVRNDVLANDRAYWL